ncbi:MAG: hypothetical protein ACOH5I_14100 [Oligoflexus sp.]
MRNQFPVAEAHFKRAFSSSKTREDRAFILKFLGISQFMRGDKRQAANSFYQAFMNDQKTAIYQEEVLDPTVVDFYNTLKVKWTQTLAKRQQVREPAVPPLPSSRQADNQPTEDITSAESISATSRMERLRASQKPRTASRDRSKTRSSRDISWMHFMPFGIGQFYNEQYVLGTFYLGTQIFAGGLYMRRNSQVAEETSKKDRVLETEGIDQADKDEFSTLIDDRISLLEQEAGYAIMGFGLSWGVSILHGILSAPTITETVTYQRQKTLPPHLKLKNHETLDDWYVSHTPTRNYFHISPRSNGGWLLHFSIDIP